jgi:hypothetical protein
MAASLTVARAALWAAAGELGAVYRQLSEQRLLPLDRWAIPQGEVLNSRLLLALAAVYHSPETPIMDRYRSAYRLVIPALRDAAQRAARKTLSEQATTLSTLNMRFGAQGMPERLHLLALDIAERAGGFLASQADVAAAGEFKSWWGPTASYDWVRAINANTRSRIGSLLAAQLAPRAALDPREMAREESQAELALLARVLFAHPRGVDILTAYAQSAAAGSALAHRLVADAVAATQKFAADLTAHPEDVWRYAPLVLEAVRALGLYDFDGFPEYAVDLGQMLGRSKAEAVFRNLGLVVLCVGLVFSGPVGLVAVGVADLALTASGGALAYLRERQQDMAAQGSAFRAQGRLAEPSDYSDTLMAGAAALVSALVLLGPGAQLLRNVRPRPPGTLPPRPLELARPGSPSVPLEGRQLERALERSGASPSLSSTTMRERSLATKTNTRIGAPSDGLSVQKMTANTRKLDSVEAARLGPGAPRELDPSALEDVRGVGSRLGGEPPRVDTIDYNVVPEDWFVEMPPVRSPPQPLGSWLDEETMAARSAAAGGAPPLDRLKRANMPGRTQGRVIPRAEQLHDLELKPALKSDLTLRNQTPTEDLREWARRQLPVGAPDPIIPSLPVDAAVADHIVALELIRQFPGFGELGREAKIAVVNMPENIMAVSRRVNSARGSTPYVKWAGIEGHPVPEPIRAAMIVRERAAATAVQARIENLLREQYRVRGLTPNTVPVREAIRAPSTTVARPLMQAAEADVHRSNEIQRQAEAQEGFSQKP